MCCCTLSCSRAQKPIFDINTVMNGVIYLFYEPNPEDPLNKASLVMMMWWQRRFLGTQNCIHLSYVVVCCEWCLFSLVLENARDARDAWVLVYWVLRVALAHHVTTSESVHGLRVWST